MLPVVLVCEFDVLRALLISLGIAKIVNLSYLAHWSRTRMCGGCTIAARKLAPGVRVVIGDKLVSRAGFWQ